MSSEFLVYGTRTSKDKSGAYLFLPDGEAKVQAPPLRASWQPCPRPSNSPAGSSLSAALLPPQPYAPKDPPVVRVTEGPLFSEVVSYYQHVQTVVRLYNVPGETVRGCARKVTGPGVLGNAAHEAQPLTACSQGWRACPWTCLAWWTSVTTSTRSWPCASALTSRAMTPSSQTSMASRYPTAWGGTAAAHGGTVPCHLAPATAGATSSY